MLRRFLNRLNKLKRQKAEYDRCMLALETDSVTTYYRVGALAKSHRDAYNSCKFWFIGKLK